MLLQISHLYPAKLQAENLFDARLSSIAVNSVNFNIVILCDR